MVLARAIGIPLREEGYRSAPAPREVLDRKQTISNTGLRTSLVTSFRERFGPSCH